MTQECRSINLNGTGMLDTGNGPDDVIRFFYTV